jgi:hypothetical protein
MNWHRSRYFKIGISGFLSGTLIVLIVAYAFMGNRVGVKNPNMAYRAETPSAER